MTGERFETPDDELDPEDITLRNICRQLSDADFFSIHPIWSTKIDDMQFWYTHPDCSDNMFVDCDINKLISTNDNLFNIRFSRQFDGDWCEDERFCRTLIDRWQKGLGVDPPEVSFRNNRSSIGDGRHRTILAKELGAKRIIIRIRTVDYQLAKNLLDATSIVA